MQRLKALEDKVDTDYFEISQTDTQYVLPIVLVFLLLAWPVRQI